VDALNGEPGIYSARYTGKHEDTDEDRNNYLLEKMQGVEHRTARFVSCISCTFPNGDRIDTRGECEGEIMHGVSGKNGFGYDPLFLPVEYGGEKTMAQLTAEEKDAISHRGKSVRMLAKQIEEDN
jgi:XTP/dITP diphosphohydrolase